MKTGVATILLWVMLGAAIWVGDFLLDWAVYAGAGSPSSASLTLSQTVVIHRTLLAVLVAALGLVITFYTHRRRQMTQETRDRDNILQGLLRQSPVSTVIYDAAGTLVSVNAAALEMFGIDSPEQVVGKYNLFEDPVLNAAGAAERIRSAVAAGKLDHVEIDYDFAKVRPDLPHAAHRMVNGTYFPIQDSRGRTVRIVFQHEDVTIQRWTEQELQAVNRILRVLNAANQALAHADGEERLLAEICRILVEVGDYRAAWVGLREDDARQSVRVAGCAGFEQARLEAVGLTWADEPTGRGPVGTAIRTGKLFVAQDLTKLPVYADLAQTDPINMRAVMGLPLAVDAQVIGAIGIAARQDHSFSPEQVELLTELGNNVAFGIAMLRARVQRQQAVAQLQESRRALATLMSNLPGMAYRCRNDNDWTMEFVSDGCVELTGYQPADLIENGRVAFGQLIVAEDRPQVWDQIQESLSRKAPFHLTYRLSTADGQVKWVWEQGRGVPGADGALVALEVFITDVTERRTAEEELRRSEERFAKAFNTSAVGMFICTRRSGVFIDANDAYLKIIGMTKDEVVGQSSLDLNLWTDPKGRAELTALLERDRCVRDRMFDTRAKSGAIRRLLASVEIIELAGHECILTLATDVTDRLKAEAAIRDSEERYRRLVELSPSVIYIHCEGKIVFINQAGAKLLGAATPGEIVGRPFMDFIHPDYRDIIRQRVGQLRQGVGVPMLEEKYLRLDGTSVDVEVVAAPFTYEGKPAVQVMARDITARRLAEDALRESEALYRTLVRTSPDAVVMTDLQGRIILLSERTLEMLGAAGSLELLGKDAFDLVVAEDRPKAMENVRRALREPVVGPMEYSLQRKDGTTFVGEINAAAVSDAQGKPKGFIVTIRDITQRKRTGAAIDHLASFPRFAPSPIVEVGLDGHIRYANPAARNVFLDLDKLGPKHPFLAGLDRVGERLAEQAEKTLFREIRVHDLWFAQSVTLVPESRRLRVYGLDITLRRQAEDSLRQEHDFATSLVETAQAVVLVLDEGGRILRFNRFAQELTGYSEEQAKGKNWFDDFLPPDVREQARPLFSPDPRRERTRGQVAEVLTRDGRRVSVRWWDSPLHDPSGQVIGLLATGYDITEILTIEEQLRQAAKMEAIGRLAGGIAHDFNNMLAIIQGYSDLLSQSVKNPDDLDDVRKIGDAARRAAGMTGQLLAFGRKQVIQPRLVRLNEVVNGLAPLLQRTLGEDVEFVCRTAGALWSTRADPSQLEQVILNMAVNAREAMPKGGRFVIETSNVTLDQEFTRLHPELSHGEHVTVAFSDTGVGMSKEVMAHIFEPFYSTKGSLKNSGLGLATCHGIIQQSGGCLTVTSEPGAGTVFQVFLPRAVEPPPPKAGPRTDELPPVPGGAEAILLVEDEPAVKDMAARLLTEHGYAVTAAAGVPEALQAAQGRQFDLLLTDVVLPHATGKELAEQLVAADPKLKVLFMSGYSGDTIPKSDGVVKEGINFLPKPFTARQLAQAVRNALDKGK